MREVEKGKWEGNTTNRGFRVNGPGTWERCRRVGSNVPVSGLRGGNFDNSDNMDIIFDIFDIFDISILVAFLPFVNGPEPAASPRPPPPDGLRAARLRGRKHLPLIVETVII